MNVIEFNLLTHPGIGDRERIKEKIESPAKKDTNMILLMYVD